MKQKFLNPEEILTDAGLQTGMTVADMGSGNGFFTIPAAQIVGDQGAVWAIDILEEALGQVASSARLNKLKNIKTMQCDLDSMGSCKIPELSCDFVIIGKVLPQMSKPETLVREAYRILKTGGKLVVVEWHKKSTPIGPPMEQRVGHKEAQDIFAKQGFRYLGGAQPDGYHYALLFQK